MTEAVPPCQAAAYILFASSTPIGLREVEFPCGQLTPMQRPEIAGLAIVLVGDFNPRIFQPQWFALQEIITREEADSADVEIIHSDICLFRLAWCQVQVTKDRYIVSTTQDPYFENLRELTVKVFSALSHTPISVMGINPEAHYRMRTVDALHSLGHKLAPKDMWARCLDNPGLRTLVIEKSHRRDSRPGRIRVRLEPSSRIVPGFFVQMNDHYKSGQPGQPGGAEEFMNILEKSWENSMGRWAG